MPGDETIGIFPLASGRLPGKTWEPDVLVTYKKRVGVLEIDGPQHNARRAMDMSRDNLWLDTGVAYVDRITVEALANPRELEAFLRKFLKRLAETR
jgi:very-short-patch-repair endonuclease